MKLFNLQKHTFYIGRPSYPHWSSRTAAEVHPFHSIPTIPVGTVVKQFANLPATFYIVPDVRMRQCTDESNVGVEIFSYFVPGTLSQN